MSLRTSEMWSRLATGSSSAGQRPCFEGFESVGSGLEMPMPWANLKRAGCGSLGSTWLEWADLHS